MFPTEYIIIKWIDLALGVWCVSQTTTHEGAREEKTSSREQWERFGHQENPQSSMKDLRYPYQ